jgi:hypothetical protein
VFAEFERLQRVWDTVPAPDEETRQAVWNRLATSVGADGVVESHVVESDRRLRRRPLVLVLATATVVAAVTGSALALSGHLGGLFGGTPVHLSARERFELSVLTGFQTSKVTQIATREGLVFYALKQRNGRRCYGIGIVRKHLTPAQAQLRDRFDALDCGPGGSSGFPSKTLPLLDSSPYRAGPPVYKPIMSRLLGFAADPVASVGVIGPHNTIVYSAPVVHNVYVGSHPPKVEARGIVAFGADGKPLYVQCSARGGCGSYRSSPAPPARKITPFRSPAPSGHPVTQDGAADGASVHIRGSQVEFRLSNLPEQTRQRLTDNKGRIGLACYRFVRFAGRLFNDGIGNSEKRFAPTLSVNLGSTDRRVTAPFDGCTVTGTYGHSWNDGLGTHDTVEIPLTARGRRFFADRAVARDLAWLARARVFRDIRYANPMPPAASAAARLGRHVVALPHPTATPPPGKIGLWTGTGARVVLVERTPTGKRLFLDYRHGRIYRTNFAGLTTIL